MNRPDPARPASTQPDPSEPVPPHHGGPARWFVFPRRDPTRESRLMGAVRMGWNFTLSAMIGAAVGGFGSQLVGDAAGVLFGDLPVFWSKAIATLGWVVGCGTAFVSFMSYYLDDSEG